VAEPLRRARAQRDWLAAATAGAGAAAWAAAFLSVAAGALGPWTGVSAVVAGLAVAVAVATRGSAGADPRSRMSWPEALALAAFGVVSVRQFGWLAFRRGGALLTLLPYNYGDLPLHWTYVAHLAGGARFWPENPIFTGERLRYPLGVDLLTAVPVQLGVSMPIALVALGLAGAALTVLALRRWGGAFAVAGFLFAGGLAGFELLWTGTLHDYQSAVAWKSPYLALFVPQRGFLLALPMGLLLLWSWRRRLLRDEGRSLAPFVEGVLWGTLPLVHLHSFLFVSAMFAAWTVGSRRWRAAAPPLAVALLPAAWSVWQVTDGFRAASLVGWKPGWMIGGEGAVVFLLLNFGLFLPLALAALVVAVRRRRREEGLVLGSALAAFAALFVVRLAPWEWDNTKVMVWCYVATLPPIEALVLSPMRRSWRGVTLFGLLFSGAVSVAAASVGEVGRLEVLDLGEYRAVCAALRPLGRDERVATVQTHNHPVALCGQPIVAGYAGHLWSHGLAAGGVERGLARLLRGEGDFRSEARALGARYLFWGHREQSAFPRSAKPWVAAGPPVASGEWGALYRME
jgi:hypothetical protein